MVCWWTFTTATGTAERDVVPYLINDARARGFHPTTLGADKGYDTRDCVQTLRAQRVTPHVAQNTTSRRRAFMAYPCSDDVVRRSPRRIGPFSSTALHGTRPHNATGALPSY